MRISTRRVKASLAAAAVLVSGFGLTAVTATPASSASACGMDVSTSDGGKRAHATNTCDDKTFKRKFVWNNGPDSLCTTFRPGVGFYHDRPFSWSKFGGMKAC